VSKQSLKEGGSNNSSLTTAANRSGETNQKPPVPSRSTAGQ
jgi:hypothetical protein